MPRTAMLIVVHDTTDPKARASLEKLLMAAGKGVEVQWLDELRAAALIEPSDLAPDRSL